MGVPTNIRNFASDSSQSIRAGWSQKHRGTEAPAVCRAGLERTFLLRPFFASFTLTELLTAEAGRAGRHKMNQTMKQIRKRSVSLLLSAIFAISVMANGTIPFSIQGIQAGDKAVVIVSSEAYLTTMTITADGDYSFQDVPTGTHYVKAEATGYNVQDAQKVIVNEDGSIIPVVGIKLAITKMEGGDTWTHSWHDDGSVSGYTTTAHVNTPPEVDFLGKQIVPADVPSFALLQSNYKILLADEEEAWTQEYAYRFLETLKMIPVDYLNMPIAKFTLTAAHLEDDITVTDLGEGKEVLISKDAFYYANPFLVSLDGVRGRFFSKRLHHALVKYATNFGNDKWRVGMILQSRFGCSIDGFDYEALTGETAGAFQEFYPSELVAIINMFEELPEGFHATPHLKYLVRRQDGHTNPIYPGAAAIAWCQDEGYIEFMWKAFGGNNEQFDTQRVILHEKTHFLWAYSFSEDIRNDWAEVGGWYLDPNAADGWSTTKDTEFVTAYSHGKNPNEDMAESVAYYLKNPDLLLSRAPEKYDFIRDRIMHGTRYISSIPDYLTFEVLNLWPDYDYPGKIKRVDIKVEGAPEEDKLLTFEIELSHQEGYEDGASYAFTRIMSPRFYDEEGKELGTYIDLYFSPVDGNDHILRGTTIISKYSKAGYWVPGDITVSDLVGNSRYEGRNDCVTNIYINNPLEDLEAPKYEKGSLEYILEDVDNNGHHEQLLTVKFKASDNIGIEGVYGGLFTGVDSNHMPSWNTDIDKESNTITLQYRIRDYYYTADYYIASISITDFAGLSRDIRFSEDPKHEPVQKIHIETPNPDYEHPEIDLNRIYVHAEPTHPEAPDGETLVEISLYIRDNIAGLSTLGITLRDPQGIDHGYGVTPKVSPAVEYDQAGYFVGDPYLWRHYVSTIVLPQGSAPGIWGISAINVRDLAFNDFTYNFVETMIFEPDDSETDYVLFADLDENSLLTLGINSETLGGYGYRYRIICDETGEEINGTLSAEQKARAMTRAASTGDTQIDLSEWPDGKIIVIVQVLDEEGNVTAVRSKTLMKSVETKIVEKTTNIETIVVYTIDGKRLNQPQRGLNIVRMSDGTMKKVVIK